MIVLRKHLKATPEEVWAAFADAALLARWLHCQVDSAATAENDFREGGAWRVSMHRGGRPCGEAHGVWRELRPHTRLVFSWSAPTTGVRDSEVRVTLRPRGEETELLLEHDLEPTSTVGARHLQGWQHALEHLALRGAPPMEHALDTARRWHHAWSTGAFDEARALLHPSLQVEVPINAYADAAAFMVAVQGFAGLLTEVTLHAALGDAEQAMLLYDVAAPGLGRLRIAEHFTVRGGRITRVRQVHDTAPIRALGLGA